MAFDFKGSGGNIPRPNNTSSSSGSNNPSSFNNIPRPGGNNPSSIPKPADTSAARNTGFQNRPEVRSGGGVTPPSATPDNGNGRRKTAGPKRPSTRQRSSGAGNTQIPVGLLFTIIGIVVVIICLWVFRDPISAFLTQVLTWVITILIIIFLIKWFIFPKRRR